MRLCAMGYLIAHNAAFEAIFQPQYEVQAQRKPLCWVVGHQSRVDCRIGCSSIRCHSRGVIGRGIVGHC